MHFITSSKFFRYTWVNKFRFTFFTWSEMGKQNNTVKFAVPGFFGSSGVPGCSGFPVFRGVPGCSGVFRGVPGCSGVFRGVPVFLVLVNMPRQTAERRVHS